MDVFLYDKSFEGLLSAVFDAFALKRFPGRLAVSGDIPLLPLHYAHTVITGADKAGRVFQGLRKRLSPRGRDNLMLVWLSEQPGSDTLLFRHICAIFNDDHADDTAAAAAGLAAKVAGERHRMYGFARFQKTAEGVYFSSLAPKYNVLPLLLQHFADRFGGQQWILYDTARAYGAFFNGREFQELFLNPEHLRDGQLHNVSPAEDEKRVQTLWKSYFKAIAVQERLNPALQRRCMPRRYWCHLTEKQE
ncbi:MAG: TIGR03915 family putative DNA repair protein [Desulfovibrio sp.]|jgi:probable DNA metabolism protein|nr:TIGR03915 family putative DNA repair protein [Desulfovibrio sp.]